MSMSMKCQKEIGFVSSQNNYCIVPSEFFHCTKYRQNCILNLFIKLYNAKNAHLKNLFDTYKTYLFAHKLKKRLYSGQLLHKIQAFFGFEF